MAMSSLIPGVLFQNTGLNQSHTPTDITASPGDIKKKYRKSSINGAEWPPDSPVAKIYDVRNTSSKLILLNNKMDKQSHLRAQSAKQTSGTRPTSGFRPSSGSRPATRKVETERHFRSSSPPNPDRHTSCLDSSSPPYAPVPSNAPPGYSGSGSQHRRARSAAAYVSTEPQTPEWHHYSSQVSTGSQLRKSDNTKMRKMKKRGKMPEPPPSFKRDKSWIQHPDMTLGQKRYIHEIASVYDMTHMKQLKQAQYVQLIYREQQRGFFTPENYQKYLQYLNSDRIRQFNVPMPPSVIADLKPKTVRSGRRSRPSGKQSAPRSKSEMAQYDDQQDRASDDDKENQGKISQQEQPQTKQPTTPKKSSSTPAMRQRKPKERPKSPTRTSRSSSSSSSSSSNNSENIRSPSRLDRPKTSVGSRSHPRPSRTENEMSKDYWEQPSPPDKELEPNGDGVVMTKDNQLQKKDEHILETIGRSASEHSSGRSSPVRSKRISSAKRRPVNQYRNTYDRDNGDGTQTRVYNPQETGDEDPEAAYKNNEESIGATQTETPSAREEAVAAREEKRYDLESDHESEEVQSSTKK